ncbi:uncharacterized protein LOC129093858 [Anoplopoma fimbria]|uniref:uncharacterized protein LOC129093858 n=1 Tax=Anoplopoma fimbria TaxID=229290 RepID=UPI0023EDA312|nr:uncharacterized protein LOC129093858 [Anoplopoma fimbria]
MLHCIEKPSSRHKTAPWLLLARQLMATETRDSIRDPVPEQKNSLIPGGGCGVITDIPAGLTFHFSFSAIEGRYVTVRLPGSQRILSLCEVEVFPVDHAHPRSNVALKGAAAQSSTLPSGEASKAIDGRRNSFYSNGFCSHTAEDETNPWWRVDLGRTYVVTSIKVTNRGDCCAERLDGAEIRIGNSLENNGNNNPRCASISHIKAGKTNTYRCDGGSMDGRFVNVIIPGEGKTLTLCEVEVYGAPAEDTIAPTDPPVVSVMLNGRSVTVVGERLCWSDALFFCRSNHWDLLSLRSQEEQSEVELLLNSTSFPLTDYVWLGLRRYIMADTWFWMSGDAMKFTKWPQDIAPHLFHNPCGGMAIEEPFQWEDQHCDQLLNFICQSGAEFGSQKVYYETTATSKANSP